MILFWVLSALAVMAMLGFTAVFYRLSPYNGMGINPKAPSWEKMLLWFIMAYPAFSLCTMLIPDGLAHALETGNVLRRSTFLIFSVAHIFLSAMSAVVSHRFYNSGFVYQVLFALSVMAGSAYLMGLLIAFMD